MAKASFTLPNGTAVTIEGSVEEVNSLLTLYNSGQSAALPAASPLKRPVSSPPPKAPASPPDEVDVDLMAIVNHIKSCDEAEAIEKRILDQSNQLTRVLLPMYIVHEHMNNAHGLTSGQISKVTVQLGVPVQQPNVSKTLAGAASKYIIGDVVRKNGQAVKYKLSRRGHTHLKDLLSATK